MANLKEIRIRIQSVKSTRQITSAMKMVSAAKLRKAQDAIFQMRPYANKLQQILSNLAGSLTEEKSVFTQQREVKRALLIVITSNRGLCGAFNSNVIKKAFQIIDEEYLLMFSRGDLDIIAIGKKGADLLRTKKAPVTISHHDLVDHVNFSNVEKVISGVMNDFINRKYDKIDLIYNQFKNAASQVLTREQFLPVLPSKKTEDKYERIPDYILEPSKDEIIEELIPKSLKIQFFKALLDSLASEHGARMTAMHKATDNATDLIRDLELNYNKARQATITKEILEIVSGAEALKG